MLSVDWCKGNAYLEISPRKNIDVTIRRAFYYSEDFCAGQEKTDIQGKDEHTVIEQKIPEYEG